MSSYSGEQGGRDGESLRSHGNVPPSLPDTTAQFSHNHSSSFSAPPIPPIPSSPKSSRTPNDSRANISSRGAESSRPGSSGSKTSRSHVPALASQAFFKPMSSQRLQAQRSARTNKMFVAAGSNRNNGQGINGTASGGQPKAFPSFLDDAEIEAQDDETIVGGVPNNKARLPYISESRSPLRPSAINDKHDSGESKSASSYKGVNGKLSHQSIGTEKNASRTTQLSPLSSQYPENKPARRSGLNYQYFSGNTIFCFGGRFQNTRDRPVNIASAIVLILPAIMFLASSGPYLSKHASPAVPFFFAYLFFICLSSFIHASATDPGILPRHLHLEESTSTDPLDIAPQTRWTRIKSLHNSEMDMEVPTKYCKTCKIWRPPRCHHCRVCDNCVETQDHHCVWINNCVGRRNYRYFFTFVSSATLLGIYLIFASLGHCLHYASAQHVSFAKSVNVNRVPFAMFIYGILAAAYPACLWGYHLWLMAKGQTTREYLNSLKFIKPDRHRPFTYNSIVKNWISVLGRPRPPTYLRFKKEYEEGDQRLGPRRSEKHLPQFKRKQRQKHQEGGPIELQNVKPVMPK